MVSGLILRLDRWSGCYKQAMAAPARIPGSVSLGTYVPVSLGGEAQHHLGGTAPAHEAAATEVRGPAPAAFPDELRDRQRLDHRSCAQGGPLLHAWLLGTVLTLQVPKDPRSPGCLLGLTDGQGRMRSSVTEVGVLQGAHILAHPGKSQTSSRQCGGSGHQLHPPLREMQRHLGQLRSSAHCFIFS